MKKCKLLVFFAIILFHNAFSFPGNCSFSLGLTAAIAKGWGPAPLLFIQYGIYNKNDYGILFNFKTLVIGYYEVTLEPCKKFSTSDYNSLVGSAAFGYSLSLFHHSVVFGGGISDDYYFNKMGLSFGTKIYVVDYGNTSVMGYHIASSDIHITFYPYAAALLL